MSKRKDRVPKGYLFVRTEADSTVLIQKSTSKALYTSKHATDSATRLYMGTQAERLKEGVGWDATDLLAGDGVTYGAIVSYIVG